MKNIFINIIVIVANVKDLILTMLDSKGHIVKMLPYDDKLTKKALMWKKRLQKQVPSLKVTFTGSASLKLPGQKDLDFVIRCEENSFSKESKRLIKLLGKPFKKYANYIEWRKSDKGVNVDILMASMHDRMYMRITDAHEILLKNKKLFNEYKNLKEGFNGRHYKQFELKRAFLFNKIFYKYGRGLDFIFNK